MTDRLTLGYERSYILSVPDAFRRQRARLLTKRLKVKQGAFSANAPATAGTVFTLVQWQPISSRTYWRLRGLFSEYLGNVSYVTAHTDARLYWLVRSSRFECMSVH